MEPRIDDSADEIMQRFARRTGVEPETGPSRRYLWTDAFAVCYWLGRFLDQGDAEALRLALRLVEQTHHVLGRHRPDDRRRGWISGLDEEKGLRHPTVGGLRIGKSLPERLIGEPCDPDREWDRDGQYFHYLTKWIYALECVSRATQDPTYRDWAIELARTAHARFVVSDAAGSPMGLHWKMSVDLSRSLVPSMGQHDPLDGLIAYCRLQVDDGPEAKIDLSEEIRDAERMCRGRSWYTDDVLGIGGLLTDAYSLARLPAAAKPNESEGLLRALLEASVAGLEEVVRSRLLDAPVGRRLAFRELGLSIGLRALSALTLCVRGSGKRPSSNAFDPLLESLARYQELAPKIEEFWREPAKRRTTNWSDHQDINDVMLATSLAPRGYLEI